MTTLPILKIENPAPSSSTRYGLGKLVRVAGKDQTPVPVLRGYDMEPWQVEGVERIAFNAREMCARELHQFVIDGEAARVEPGLPWGGHRFAAILKDSVVLLDTADLCSFAVEHQG